jgi:hypothetical protein
MAMWQLLEDYEELMALRDPVDPGEKVKTDDQWNEDGVIAAIESTWGVHEHRGTCEVRAQRQMPANLQINVNLPLNLPPGLDPATLPEQLQQLIAQMLQATQQDLVTRAQQAVNEALKAQAPLIGAEVAFRGGAWRLSF